MNLLQTAKASFFFYEEVCVNYVNYTLFRIIVVWHLTIAQLYYCNPSCKAVKNFELIVQEKELYGLIFSPFFTEEDKIADCASSDTQPIHERT